MEGNLTLFGPEPYPLSLQLSELDENHLERYLYCTLNVEHDWWLAGLPNRSFNFSCIAHNIVYTDVR